MLHNPRKQFNGDETGFQLYPKTERVIGPKGVAIYSESVGNREQMSVLITMRADGNLMTSAIVYPYKKCIPKNVLDSMPSGFSIAKSDSGWMTPAIFFEYFANAFIPELAAIRRQEKGLGQKEELILTEKDWVVFWMDGYASHLMYHTSQLCELNHIVLYHFKAHSSHICQLNDVGPFKPLKNEWRKAVSEWRLSHPYTSLTKSNFAAVLKEAMKKLDPNSIIAGYRTTGLFPFDEHAVHYKRLTATNQRKYDEAAFGDMQSDVDVNAAALLALEHALGEETVAQYKVRQRCGPFVATKYPQLIVHDTVTDEIKNYIDCRYIGAMEAVWHIFHFPLQDRHPAVQRLDVYLEHQQRVIFQDGQGLMLLHVRGVTSFTDLRTVNGQLCETFKDACSQLNLLEDDAE